MTIVCMMRVLMKTEQHGVKCSSVLCKVFTVGIKTLFCCKLPDVSGSISDVACFALAVVVKRGTLAFPEACL